MGKMEKGQVTETEEYMDEAKTKISGPKDLNPSPK